jgi:rod shape determining protein RodA
MIKDAGKVDLDMSFLIVPILLVVIGCVCLYSASTALKQPIFQTPFGRQLIWMAAGIFAGVLFFIIPVRIFNQGAFAFYGLSIGLLILVFFMHTGIARRWIDLGFFQFQPSEAAKFSTVLMLSKTLSDWKESKLSLKQVLIVLFLTGVPFVLIAKEPDIGTAMVFAGLFIGMVFWAGIDGRIVGLSLVMIAALVAGLSWWSLSLFLSIVIVIMVVMKKKWWAVSGTAVSCFLLGLLGPRIWAQLATYQQKRILIFLGMKSDPHGSAYQVIQSKVAIGSGGLFGKGFLHGSQTQLRFLPEQHNDFIFSVLGEEFGFIGVLIVLGLFFYLFHQMIQIAKTSRNRFAGFVVIGCTSMFAFQVLVNIGMTIGLAPVTGLPLPFLSYGGSFLIISMGIMGLLANISAKRYRY